MVNDILELKGFEELKQKAPVLIESLVGDIEEIDVKWEIHGSKLVYDFFGSIENTFIKSGAKTFNLPKKLKSNLTAADKVIDSHIEKCREAYNGMVKFVKRNIEDSLEQQKEEDVQDEKLNSDIVYSVTYSEKTREILINNFLIAKPDFDSENEKFFSYIFKNPNKKISIQTLLKEAELNSLKKPIHRILSDLGFTGNFHRVFFNASNKGVEFRNPITRKDLTELGIYYLKIQEKK